MMPPVTIHTIRVPQAQGGRFRHARHDERLLTLPVVVPGAATGRDETRRWARALDPLKGEGTLTVIQGEHAGRQLVCVYETGLEEWEEEGYESLGLTTLAFRAADPYWQDGSESSVVATLNDTAFTWFPFLPLVLGASDVFASITIDNVGDVDAWPVITVIGPGTEFTATNLTTGLSWQFTGTIGSGSELVVDTRPGHKTVRLNGANEFDRLTETSALWPLVPGPNRISLAFATVTAATTATFAWRQRWLSA